MKYPELYTLKELQEAVGDTEILTDDTRYQFLRLYGKKIEEVVDRYISKQRPENFIFAIYDLGIFVKTPSELQKSRSQLDKYFFLTFYGSLINRMRLLEEEEYLIKLLKIDKELLSSKILKYKNRYDIINSERAGNKIGWEHIIDDIVYMLKKMDIKPKYQIEFFFDLFSILEYKDYGKGIYQKQQKDRIRHYIRDASTPLLTDLLN